MEWKYFTGVSTCYNFVWILKFCDTFMSQTLFIYVEYLLSSCFIVEAAGGVKYGNGKLPAFIKSSREISSMDLGKG